MLDFLHRLLRPIVVRDGLPEKTDWDDVMSFDCTNVQLLSLSQFMEEIEFSPKAARAAKGRFRVEREKSKKTNFDAIASAAMGDMFNPHVDQREHIFGMNARNC